MRELTFTALFTISAKNIRPIYKTMHVAVVSLTDHAVWQFRSEFIAAMLANGMNVTVICPDGPYAQRIRAVGAAHIPLSSNRFVAFFSDGCYLFRLYFLLRKLKPDAVYTMTTKPNMFAPFLAKCSGVKMVCSVFGGIGFLYTDGGRGTVRCVKAVGRFLMRCGTRFTDVLVFQNPDDKNVFERQGILKGKRFIITGGSGVNLREFSCANVDNDRVKAIRQEFGVNDDGQLVVMISRIAKNKGILEFIEASASFVDEKRKVRFVHIGPYENGSPESVPKEALRETATFLQAGYRTDIKEILHAADLAVLPSYHREGIPNTLLEAAAMKRAIVTTDNVGCRETVVNGVNGLLVPVRDATALTNAVRRLLGDDELRRTMGEAGLERIRQHFTVEAVNRSILENVFELKNAVIPEFFTEELDGKLRIVLDGQERWVNVTPIDKEHTLDNVKVR